VRTRRRLGRDSLSHARRPRTCPVPLPATPTGASASRPAPGTPCDKTIRNWIKAGLITGYRKGPRLLEVDLDEIDRIIRPVA